jgi:hypothetical protein
LEPQAIIFIDSHEIIVIAEFIECWEVFVFPSLARFGESVLALVSWQPLQILSLFALEALLIASFVALRFFRALLIAGLVILRVLGALFIIERLLAIRFLGILNSSGSFLDGGLHRDLYYSGNFFGLLRDLNNSGSFLDNGLHELAFLNLFDLLPNFRRGLFHQLRVDFLVLGLLGLQCGDFVLHLGNLLLNTTEVVIFLRGLALSFYEYHCSLSVSLKIIDLLDTFLVLCVYGVLECLRGL